MCSKLYILFSPLYIARYIIPCPGRAGAGLTVAGIVTIPFQGFVQLLFKMRLNAKEAFTKPG